LGGGFGNIGTQPKKKENVSGLKKKERKGSGYCEQGALGLSVVYLNARTDSITMDKQLSEGWALRGTPPGEGGGHVGGKVW